MEIIDYILDEVHKTESHNITNIIVQYQDLVGGNFFHKMNHLQSVLRTLKNNHSLKLIERGVVRNKFWEWNLPIYFDPKFHFLQFDLERIKEVPFKVECGSIWRRSVDQTVVEVQRVEGRSVMVKVIEGQPLMNDMMNFGTMQLFWTKVG